MSKLDTLEQNIIAHFGEGQKFTRDPGELTLVVPVSRWRETCQHLHDAPELAFDMCMDLCGVDYQGWGVPPTEVDKPNPHFPQRFAVVAQLLSTVHNWRLRVKTFAESNEFPVVPSVLPVWNGVNWFEREAYDLFGIVFEDHPDLRRILTDYGFIGHPFRKDFPLSGHVEMVYDEALKRVIYQPVTIEPREITPRIIREEHYGAARKIGETNNG